ncbi:ABC transporter ATP-binding protein [Loktanella sp. S4079]|uniref:ABC transporter ATP-binding protein n=1 Tax=Loktanella sp. S4079 TaxID=579483 RepID=UPI000A0746C5|nr:ABC transporter ATP-binding protein [Loktanella sp. S4079]
MLDNLHETISEQRVTPERTVTTPAALSACNLGWHTATGEVILDNVSFELGPGRMMGVIGPNGAGKSTLLRLLYRFYRPTSGKILLDGQSLWGMRPRDAACQVTAVLQEQPTDFALTVREIVALGRAPHRRALARGGIRDAQIVSDALERLNLDGMEHRAFGTLSGGEKQRVMVARALAQQPKLLILDEPTNHLDIRHQLEVLTLVRNLGITIVTSLHDLNLAAGLCDDVLVLERGKTLAFGPPVSALTPQIVSQAFSVDARREVLQPSQSPHFTFHLPENKGQNS